MTTDDQPPHSLETERAILGAIVLDNSLLEQAPAVDNFHAPGHRTILSAMQSLAASGTAIDLVTVRNALQGNGQLEAVGGVTYVSGLIDGVPKVSNIEHYVEIVTEKATLRKIVCTGEAIRTRGLTRDTTAADLLEFAEKSIAEIGQKKRRAASITTDWSKPPSERQWLIPDWLPAGRVGLLTGKGGAGKSRLALQLAASIAAGSTDWLPDGGPELTEAGPAPVVFATWEDEPDELARRLQGRKHAKGRVQDFGDRLHGLDFAGRGSLWAPPPRTPASTPGDMTSTGRWLRAYCEKLKPLLLVIDPLAAAFACNENDRGIVRQFMSDWDGWARSIGCAVLMAAHPSKAFQEYSGSTDWQAAARFVWTLGLEKEKERGQDVESEPGKPLLMCRKSSYAKPPDSLRLHGYPDWSVTEAATGVEADAQYV